MTSTDSPDNETPRNDSRRAPRFSADDIADALGRYRHTSEQKAVIEAPLEPMLVVAGAGSGKTDTMASRVVWLVANELVRPQEILGLTFTRKAAGELAERIGQRLRSLQESGLWTPQPDADGTIGLGETPTVSTYNAYAGRIVTEHGLRLGIEPDARMLSEAAAWQFAHDVVTSWDGDMSAVTVAESTVTASVLATAGQLAEHRRTPEDLDAFYADALRELETIPYSGRKSKFGTGGEALRVKARAHRQLVPLVEGYATLKRQRSSLDFADQVSLAAALADRFEQIGAGERARYRMVLLDEFQDTSEAQIAFLAGLFARGDDRPGVVAVGDPHQSIFGWRGASATTLASFAERFAAPGQARTAWSSLSQSWRNDQRILDVANAVARPLSERSSVPVPALVPRPGAGPGEVTAARFETVDEEAAAVASWIAQERATDDVTAAVLCRKRSQFVPMLEALEREGVPAEAVGLGGLLETPEVVDLVAMLWVVDDPGRGDHLMRLLTGPSMRLGPADVDALGTWAQEYHASLRDAARADGGDRADTRQASLTQDTGDAAVLGDARVTSTAQAQSEGASVPSDVPARAEADLADDTRDDASLIEALGHLPGPEWRGRDDERFSDAARRRLHGFHQALERLRALTGLPLVDFVGEAERVLGLDIEVLARPGYDPSTARAHLDAFADVAGTFSAQAERPTLGGFLDWLDAARSEERGLEMPAIEVNDKAVQVLTVHAAKGLEWDVVAVPGLVEGSFPSLDGTTRVMEGEWRFKPHTAKGWLRGLDDLPYPLRGDRAGLPHFAWQGSEDGDEIEEHFAAFSADVIEHARLEERRLAYVAFTRARRSMMLSAPVWYPGGAAPRETSSFLTELLDADLVTRREWAAMPPIPDGGEKAVNPLDAEVREAQWPLTPETSSPLAEAREAARRGAELVEHAADRRRAAGADADEFDASGRSEPLRLALEGTREHRDLEVTLLLQERDADRRRPRRDVVLPSHLSASALVALAENPAEFARRLRRPMPSEPAVAARRGTAFHAWVEQHYQQAPVLDLDELPGFDDEDASADEELPKLKANFLASEWATRKPVAVEVDVETVIAGYAVRGRIDAVFARPDGGFTVVDWKTGRRPSGERLTQRSLQIAAYAVAYARLRGLAPDQVDGAFFYAATGETYRPDLAGEHVIASLLDGVVPDEAS